MYLLWQLPLLHVLPANLKSASFSFDIAKFGIIHKTHYNCGDINYNNQDIFCKF